MIPLSNMDLSFDLVEPYTLPNELESYREQVWGSLVKDNPKVFDGTMLGLDAILVFGSSARLRCHRTSYSAYVATRDPELSFSFPRLKRANPLGLTVIAISIDQRVLVSQRSEHADQNPGQLYFIGGYASFCDGAGLNSLIDDCLRELHEEIGLCGIARSSCSILGIAFDPIHCHPEITIVVRFDQTFDEMVSNLNTAVDRHESLRVFGLPLNDVVRGILPMDVASIVQTWSFKTSTAFLAQWLGV